MAFICKQIEPTSAFDYRTKIGAELINMGWSLDDWYIPFTSGGTHEVLPGDTLIGATSGVTMVVFDVLVTSGTWGAGTAVGFFGITSLNGPFVAENLNEGVNLNVCTVAAGAGNKIYKSNSETADRLYAWILMSCTTTYINFFAYGYWDPATHAGNTVAYTSESLSYTASAKYVISGNKNLVCIHRIAYAVNGTQMLFGHIPKRFYTAPLATLTAPVTAGDGKTLSLDNTTGFIQNQTYWMMGIAGEGRDRIKVTSVNPGVSITGDGLSIGFATGAVIGACPRLFGLHNITYGFCSIFGRTIGSGAVGTGGGDYNLLKAPFVPIATLNPDDSLGTAGPPLSTVGLYVLQPILFYASMYPVGYSDENILYSPLAVYDDIYGVTSDGQPLDTGTATDGSGNTITCAGKTWGVNDYVGKTVVLVSGTGAGYTRRIVSNTATVLTVNTDWDITPNTTTIFYIVDEAYRHNSYLGVSYREYI